MSSSVPCAPSSSWQRMEVAEARAGRHALVHARVVLHRAGAERVEAVSTRSCGRSAVKWRTSSGSEISGSRGAFRRASSSGTSAFGSS